MADLEDASIRAAELKEKLEQAVEAEKAQRRYAHYSTMRAMRLDAELARADEMQEAAERNLNWAIQNRRNVINHTKQLEEDNKELKTKLEAADRLNKAYAQAVAGLREELERKDKQLSKFKKAARSQLSVKVSRAQKELARRQRTHRLPSHHLRLRTREVRQVLLLPQPN